MTSQPDIAQACEHEVPPATGTYRQDSGQDGCKQFHTANAAFPATPIINPHASPDEGEMRGDIVNDPAPSSISKNSYAAQYVNGFDALLANNWPDHGRRCNSVGQY